MIPIYLFRNSNEFEAGYILDKEVNSSQKAKMESFKGMKIKLTEDFSTAKIDVSRQWNKIFKCSEKRTFNLKVCT